MKSKIDKGFKEYYERIATKPRGLNRVHYSELTLDELRDAKDLTALSIEQVVAKSIIDVENSERKFKNLIRIDAKVLLIINFSDMVYYPLTRSSVQNRGDLKIEIYNEVQEILIEALKKNKEVSSHAILRTGLKMWKRLKTIGEDSW